jgi:hypothetical protein
VNSACRFVVCALAGAASLAPAGCQRPVASPVRYSTGNVSVLRTALGGKASAEPVAAAALPDPTGWATVRGVFKMVGTPPERAVLKVDKEQNICMPGGKPVLAEDVVVDASGGIKDIVIFLETKYPADNPKWEHPDYAAAKTTNVIFDQKACVFLTHMFALRSTQTLDVRNSDPVGHNLNIAGGPRPGNFTVAAGGAQPWVFGGEAAEPFPVSCGIHPWMAAYGIVRNSPYFAVTNAQGEFEIKNLPAGVPLKFRVWQEKAKFLRDFAAAGEAKPFKKGRMELTLANDEQKQLEFSVNSTLFGGN